MWLGRLAVIGLLVTAGAAPASRALAQSSTAGSDWSLESHHGTLLVWRVVAVAPPREPAPAPAPAVNSQTAGSFGQPAGSFGAPSGSTGQTAGSFGQNAGDSSKTAGSVGQTVGSFGESLSTLADAAAAANGSQPNRKHDAAWERFTSDIENSLRGLDVTYEDVGVDEIRTRLDAALKSGEQPDVLLGTPLPPVWSRPDSGLVRRYGLVTLGFARMVPQTETPEIRNNTLQPQASILVRARHPRAARAFVLWLSDRNICQGCEQYPREADPAVTVAKGALFSLLNGGGLGIAPDKQMAAFPPQLARDMALNVSYPGLLNDLDIRIDATAAQANERFAVVQLRAVMESHAAFGTVHAIVVLRVDEAGRWRVLQLTPNLVPEQQEVAWRSLARYAKDVKREDVAEVIGVKQAAPIDGDNRGPSPEFWWDNGGGATLEIVEWQRGSGTAWSSSNLYFVPDTDGHLRTRVTGRFADLPGAYRWRIWSVGSGGVVAISPWRGLNVVAQ